MVHPSRNKRGRFSKRHGRLISATKRVFRAAIHAPIGVGCIFAALINPFFGWAVLITFLAYEVTEDQDIRDGAWYDIVGFLVGLGIGIFLVATGKLIWSLAGA